MSLSLRRADGFLGDFDHQYQWYLAEAGETVARRYLDAVWRTLEEIASHPGIGRLRRFRHPSLQGLRSFRVRPPFEVHLIFYRYTDQELSAERLMSGRPPIREGLPVTRYRIPRSRRKLTCNRQTPSDRRRPRRIGPAVGPVSEVLVDSGFYSEQAVQKIEQTAAGIPTGTRVYAAVEKTSHHRTVADLEKKPDPVAPAPEASLAEKMRHRLQTAEGKAVYKLRQQTVEPVFGIIKAAMGFRQFLLRGLSKVSTEWTLVCLAYNVRQLHILDLAKNGVATV
ncbi:MAG: transposase [Verrucomicrobia bacterium]|nr:transposase [Verrucomicrobiota bacterium]